jgi:predicted DCC family thiol-disulfide oxidoreductase YuxK
LSAKRKSREVVRRAVVRIEVRKELVGVQAVIRECGGLEPYPISISAPTVRARLRDLGYTMLETNRFRSVTWVKTKPERTEEE